MDTGVAQPRRFATTRWSLVIAAGQRPSPESREALTALCSQYWYPLYAYVRRRGKAAEDARDLTQAFFTRLIEKNDLGAADRRQGRFRAWLLTSLKNFLANDWDHATAQKRGGGAPVVCIDAEDAEGRYRLEPSDDRTPERLYEQRFTLALLDRALRTLEQECVSEGKQLLFSKLVGGLAGGPDLPHAELARELGSTEGAVKVAVHRLRRRYRELLCAEIAHTVETPEETEAELRQLLAGLE